jgi:hypothetical protein
VIWHSPLASILEAPTENVIRSFTIREHFQFFHNHSFQRWSNQRASPLQQCVKICQPGAQVLRASQLSDATSPEAHPMSKVRVTFPRKRFSLQVSWKSDPFDVLYFRCSVRACVQFGKTLFE